MSYTLYLARGSALYDISEISGKIEWGDSLGTIGADMSFTAAVTDEFAVQGKDIVILKNNDELFRGIVLTKTGPFDGTATCKLYDFGYFMGQSKIIMQFNGTPASAAVKQVCDKAGVDVGEIPDMKISVKKVYFNETPADIIKDILSQEFGESAEQYYIEIRGSALYIFKPFEVTGTFKPADNVAAFDVTNTPSSPVLTESVSGIWNDVIVVSGSAESHRVIAEAKDDEDIAKSGLRQTIEVIEDKNVAQASNIAKNKLKEYGTIQRTLSADMPGADNIRSGRIITYEDEENGLTGKYLIKSCRHSIDGGIHTLSADMEEWSG